MERYLKETRMLDFTNPEIQALFDRRSWRRSGETEKVKEIYHFCKDEIPFGYNADADDMPASDVLREGIGHCNSKSTLFMTLLRAVGVPCRLHGFTIYKKLQKGAMGVIPYLLAPEEIIHTWVEACLDGSLEGVILDDAYLCRIQQVFKNVDGPFCGYAIATSNLKDPQVRFNGESTFIQKEGIARDFGVFDSPDDFYEHHGTNLSGVKRLMYKAIVHKLMNANIRKIRDKRLSVRGKFPI